MEEGSKRKVSQKAVAIMKNQDPSTSIVVSSVFLISFFLHFLLLVSLTTINKNSDLSCSRSLEIERRKKRREEERSGVERDVREEMKDEMKERDSSLFFLPPFRNETLFFSKTLFFDRRGSAGGRERERERSRCCHFSFFFSFSFSTRFYFSLPPYLVESPLRTEDRRP